MKNLVLYCVVSVALVPGLVVADVYNGFEFPLGDVSFADEVLRYDPLAFGGPAPATGADNPEEALGPPGSWYVSLGRGGVIELGFTDNLIVNGGDSLPDVYIGEISGSPEDFFVALRPTTETLALLDATMDSNGDGYFEIGRFVGARHIGNEGFVVLLDLDEHFPGRTGGDLTFDAIQIWDAPFQGAMDGGTVGMDLEAVGVNPYPAIQAGDTDDDGDVDIDDLNNVRNHFGEIADFEPVLGDTVPMDGMVDINDLNRVRNHFGERIARPVPEPQSLLLLGVGAIALLACRRSTSGFCRRSRRQCSEYAPTSTAGCPDVLEWALRQYL